MNETFPASCPLQCAYRVAGVAPGRWTCSSPTLAIPGGVTAEICRTTCFPAPGPHRADCSTPIGLRFVRSPAQAVGNGQHRSGWPYALASLRPLAREPGILFDDFVEQRFCYEHHAAPHREPWIGVFHHPPNVPHFASDNEKLPVLFQRPAWIESVPFLRGGIALSRYLAEYLVETLHVPVAVVRHPTETPRQTWSEAAYRANPHKWLVQVGWYLRNTRAVFQVPNLAEHRKLRLWPPNRYPLQWVRDYDERVARYWQQRADRCEFGGVTDYPIVSADRYDQLLARNVVLTEVFDASANNVVIECIARNTPVVVNRHPAVTEYLTADYPLYMDDVARVPYLLETERVIAAHRYLATLDKSWLDADSFCTSIAWAASSIARLARIMHGPGNPAQTAPH